MTLALRCPVCRGRLERAADGRAYACGAGHSFDVAADGHVNLLLSHQRRSRQPGDSREMVRGYIDDATLAAQGGYVGVSAFAAALAVARLGDPSEEETAYRRERVWQSEWIARAFLSS